MPDLLSVSVFNSGYKPIPGGQGWDPAVQATWPATTSTLLSGRSEAVLVDALLTTVEGERLASWTQASGKVVSLVVVTHGHGDHFFGAGPTLAAFPDARLVAATQDVVDDAANQITPEYLSVWNSWFAGQFDPSPRLPTPLGGDEIEVEGHVLRVMVVGAGDGVLGTIVHVPERDLVCSGDVVYNDIHMWLWKSTNASRLAWLESIDIIAALRPQTIIVGHRDPHAPDDDAVRVLDQSRRYIEDFDAAVAGSDSATEIMDRMMLRYPTYGNPYTLFAAAASQVA
jgi:glyoxylase-like metal-dependent hydrolase (beta-lactamase superfamily II)